LVDPPATRDLVAAGPRSSRGAVLAAAMMAMVLTATEGSIVATAMPTIGADLGGFDLFSWAFAGAVSFAVLALFLRECGRRESIV